MFDAGCDEDDAARFYVAPLVCHRDPRAAADDVIDLVFGVRLLVVPRTRRPDRDADAEKLRTKEFVVSVVAAPELRNELANFESVQVRRSA